MLKTRKMGQRRASRAGRGVLAAAGLAMLAGGCRGPEQSWEIFQPDDQPRQVQKIATAQAIAGASQDATFYPEHFDAGRLNSLGVTKLQLILADRDADQPLALYIPTAPEDEQFAARQKAIEQYLTETNVSLANLEFKNEANPMLGASAREGVEARQRLREGSGGQPGGAVLLQPMGAQPSYGQ